MALTWLNIGMSWPFLKDSRPGIKKLTSMAHGLFRGLSESESESESETAIQDFTDKLSLIETTMSFVDANERRQIIFGKF